MNTLFAISSVVLYGIAAFLLMGRFFKHTDANKKFAFPAAVIAIALHGAFLSYAILSSAGQNMSITNVLSLVSLLITISMLISSQLLPNLIMLPVVLGFAALTVLASVFVPVQHIMHIELQPGLVIHITLSLFAYGTLSIAFLYALQMSFITHKLKQKGAALLHSSMPPLMLVESILFKLLLVGTGLLSVSLLSGFLFLDDMFSRNYAHKTILSLLALVVYVVLLVGQKMWGWRGRQVIGLTIAGVLLLTLAYFGSRFVREILL